MNKKIAVLTIAALIGLTACGESSTPANPTEPNKPVEPNTPVNPGESLKDFEGLTLPSKEVTYSGEVYSLVVNNLPEGATVVYTNNGKKDVGTYSVTAKVTKEGYNDKTLTATLKIIAADIKGLSLEEKEVTYNGDECSVKVQGTLPEGATVTYSCLEDESITNTVVDAGTYTIKAKVQCKNYNDVLLTTTITVLPAKFDMVTFDDQKIEYDSHPHTVSIIGNLPDGASVTYSCVEDENITNTVTNAGKYTIKASVSCKNYETKVFTAIIEVGSKDVERFVTVHNGKVYFQNALDKDRLYVYDASQENKVSKVNNNKAQYFTIFKNELYYRSDSLSPSIVRLDSDNTTSTIFGDNAEYICDDEQYIYYADNSLIGDNGIYRVSVGIDEITTERLYDGKAYYLSIIGDDIYFADGKNGKKLSKIDKTITNQNKATVVVDKKIKNMITNGTNLFLTINNLTGDYIAKFSNEKGLTKLTSDSGKYLTYHNNNLYYVNDDVANSAIFGKGVYKVSTTTDKDSSLPGQKVFAQKYENYPISSLTIQDGKLYFYETNNKKLYEYNLSTNEMVDTLATFTPKEDSKIALTEAYTEVYKNKVYYQNQYDGNCLYVYDTNTKSNIKVTSTEVNDLFVYKDYLYYRQVSFLVNKDLYRLDLKNGGEPLLISKDDCGELEIANDKIYYTKYSGKNSIYMMDLDGKNDTLITEVEGSNLRINGNRLYYVKGNTGSDNIYYIDLTSKEKTPVKVGKFKTTNFEFKDNKIYFREVYNVGTSKRLSMSDLDGNNVEIVYDVDCDPLDFIIVEDTVYYFNDLTGNPSIESYNLTTKEHKVIKAKQPGSDLQFVNGKLYLQSNGKATQADGHFYELSLDGTLTRID